MKYIRIKQLENSGTRFRFINLEQVSCFVCEYNPLNQNIMIEIKLKSSEKIYLQSKATQQECKMINQDFKAFKTNLSNYFDLSYLQ